MDWGILLGVVGVLGIPLALASLGLTMVANTPGELNFVRACFISAALISAATVFALYWNYTEGPPIMRVTTAAMAGAVIFGGLASALNWVDRKQSPVEDSSKKTTEPTMKNSPNISAARDVNIGQIGDVINQPAPAYAGKIEAEKTKPPIFGGGGNIPRTMEIGDSTSLLVFAGPQGAEFFRFAENYNLKIDRIDGQLKVSTQIRDRRGHLIAELIENEWKIAPPPKTWDRNYNRNTLEVKDEKGNIVLQVRALRDRVQLQGEWWMDEHRGVRLVSGPKGTGGQLAIFGPNLKPEEATPIRPLFRYPSEFHLGELIAQN
jgi:hypothetical protein